MTAGDFATQGSFDYGGASAAARHDVAPPALRMTSVKGIAILNIFVGSQLSPDYHQGVKRALKHLLLSVLLIVEAALFTAFLPDKIQQRMDKWIFKEQPSGRYDYSSITHPNLEEELAPLRPYALAVDGTLLLVNGIVIVALWRRRNT